MRNDDHNDDDPIERREDTLDKPTRDSRGRWLKGHCPNLKGRPRKQPEVLTDLADIRNFGNTLIEIRANGQTEMMVRRAALLHKMYEDAMKGKVSMQRFLYAEFGRNDEQLAEARLQYQHLMTKWVIENPDFHGLDAKNIPFEVRMEIAGLETTLNHYYPEQYPSHGPLASKDDSDVSDG